MGILTFFPTHRILKLSRKQKEKLKETKRNIQDKVEDVLFDVNSDLGVAVFTMHEIENAVSDAVQRLDDTVNNLIDGTGVTAKLVRFFTEEQLPKKGDHLKVERAIYTHHGIYIGNGKVIHYVAQKVQEDTVENFAKGSKIIILSENASPTKYSGEEIVKRAYRRLNESEYNLIINNCEHFARWCRWGDSIKV